MEVPRSACLVRQESKLNKVRQKYIDLRYSSLTSIIKSQAFARKQCCKTSDSYICFCSSKSKVQVKIHPLLGENLQLLLQPNNLSIPSTWTSHFCYPIILPRVLQ